MKKGFTLIELLAVIIILAVIALITIPLVINTIDEARRGSFKDSAYGIISAAEQKQAKEALKNGGKLQAQIYDLTGTDLSYKGSKPKQGKAVVNGKGQVALEMNNGTLCITKEYTDKDIKVTTVSDDNPCDGSNAGLTPEACFITADNTDGGVTITDYICNQPFVSSYDINYENCMAALAEADEDASDKELYCREEVTSYGYSIADDIAHGGTQWLIEDGIIENVVWSDPITDVVIPTKIDGKNVTTIGESAFRDNQLTNVEIPESVTTIGSWAFAHNKLTSVTIPSSVTSLECTAFDWNDDIVITNNSGQEHECK